jgi:hypothetical protein
MQPTKSQSIRMFQCSKISNLFHHPGMDQELLCNEQNTQLDLFILGVNGEHLKIHDYSLEKRRQLTLTLIGIRSLLCLQSRCKLLYVKKRSLQTLHLASCFALVKVLLLGHYDLNLGLHPQFPGCNALTAGLTLHKTTYMPKQSTCNH